MREAASDNIGNINDEKLIDNVQRNDIVIKEENQRD
jgi:hypothetical protein